jgi:hypothetical protein
VHIKFNIAWNLKTKLIYCCLYIFYGYPQSLFINSQFGTFLVSFFWLLAFAGASYYEKLWVPYIISWHTLLFVGSRQRLRSDPIHHVPPPPSHMSPEVLMSLHNCGTSVRNLLHVTVHQSIIMQWLLTFWIIWTPFTNYFIIQHYTSSVLLLVASLLKP